MWGFCNLKDILDVVLVPGVLAWLAFYLPVWQTKRQTEDRRKRFESLIKRELMEISPCEEEDVKAKRSGDWTDYQTRDFLHTQIFECPSENRDFILSLCPTLVYEVSQLWKARKAADSGQWLYYLEKLSKRYGGGISKSHKKWESLIQAQRCSVK